MEKAIEKVKALMSKSEGSERGVPGVLCTISKARNDYPDGRVVLFHWLEDRLVFYTNYTSQKFDNMAYCSVVFYWKELGVQVRIKGGMTFAPSSVSDDYWAKRGRMKQIASKISQQSRIMKSRYSLIRKFIVAWYRERKIVERPRYWGGVEIHLVSIEIMHESPIRLHKRELYYKGDNKPFYLYP